VFASVPRSGACDVSGYCRAAGIRVIETGPLDTPEAVAAVKALQADILVHAGASILRAPLIALPRLGVLNAHMGLLPRYRGMNVAEWAWLSGDEVGCSVHLIDRGIDTGPLLATRAVNTEGCTDIRGLRDAVDRAQIGLLGEVLAYAIATGALPPVIRSQDKVEPQYFSLHSDLSAVLAWALQNASA